MLANPMKSFTHGKKGEGEGREGEGEKEGERGWVGYTVYRSSRKNVLIAIHCKNKLVVLTIEW